MQLLNYKYVHSFIRFFSMPESCDVSEQPKQFAKPLPIHSDVLSSKTKKPVDFNNQVSSPEVEDHRQRDLNHLPSTEDDAGLDSVRFEAKYFRNMCSMS